MNRGQFFKVQRVIGDESDIYNGISEISKLGCRLDQHGCTFSEDYYENDGFVLFCDYYGEPFSMTWAGVWAWNNITF